MAFQINNISKTETSKAKPAFDTSFLQKEINLFSTSFSNRAKEDVFTELSVLLKAGIQLKEALELMKDSLKKKQHQDTMTSLSEAIIQGQSLSEAINAQESFSTYDYYSLKIGEETGTLAQVTEQLGSFYARKNEQRRELINALTYPMIILTTAVLVVVFMLQFVVPMFQDIFKQQNIELPAITKAIVSASEFIKSYGFILLVIFILPFLAKSFFNKKVWYKRFKGRLILKIPYLGRFVKTVYLSQFTQAVTLLTASKVPVVHSIQLVKDMIDFYPLQEALKQIEQSLLKGYSLSESIGKHALFDKKMVALVKVAEETNKNEFIFQRLNNQYNTEVQQRSKLLSAALEPFIIMLVGLLVGVILVAMYLPMFRLSSVLG